LSVASTHETTAATGNRCATQKFVKLTEGRGSDILDDSK
jgi:hypothetical protein